MPFPSLRDLAGAARQLGFTPPQPTIGGDLGANIGQVIDQALSTAFGRARPADAPAVATPAAATPAPATPAAAQFRSATFSNQAGSRPYRLYVPANLPDGAVPLVVMLHGCSQSPEDFATGTRMNQAAEAGGFVVCYPAQTPAANHQKCWNWFLRQDQARDRGEPSLIAGITRHLMAEHDIDAGRIYVAGLSAGGAAAAIMGGAYPDLFAAVGVHSGLACGAAHDMQSAFSAMHRGAPGGECGRPIPTIVFHGDRDMTVNPANAASVLAQAMPAESLRQTVTDGQVQGGHAYRVIRHENARGVPVLEHWEIRGAGHAWSGGSPKGSFTDPQGPDATKAMVAFFGHHRVGAG